MIQFTGESELVFNSKDILFSDLKYHLHKAMKKHKILDRKTRGTNHIIRIRYVITMNELRHCKSLDDYVSYSFSEHKKKIPVGVQTSYVKVFNVKLVKK